MLKYSEANKAARESVVVRDIRGTIDVTGMVQQLSETIDKLEKSLIASILAQNKNKCRDSFGPQTMSLQTYTPSDTTNDVTFKTKFNT